MGKTRLAEKFGRRIKNLGLAALAISSSASIPLIALRPQNSYHGMFRPKIIEEGIFYFSENYENIAKINAYVFACSAMVYGGGVLIYKKYEQNEKIVYIAAR